MVKARRSGVVTFLTVALAVVLASCSKEDKPATDGLRPEGDPTSIVILPAGPRTEAGSDPVQLGIQARYANGAVEYLASSPDLTWTSADETIATVNESGAAEGLTAGKVVVAASYKGQQALQVLTVSPRVVAIQLFPALAEVAVDDLLLPSVIALHEDQTVTDVSGAPGTSLGVDRTDLALVAGGAVTGLAEGETTLHASFHGHSASAALTIVAKPAPVPVLDLAIEGPAQLAQGTTGQAMATGLLEDTTSTDLTTEVAWSSSDEGVLTVSEDGLLTPVAAGTATVRAELTVDDGTLEDELAVTVLADDVVLRSIAIEPDPAFPGLAVLPLDAATSFTALGTFSDGSTQDVTADAAWAVVNASADDAELHALIGEDPGTVTTVVPPGTALATILTQGEVIVTAELPDRAGDGTIAAEYPLAIAGELAAIEVTSDLASPFVVGDLPLFTATGHYLDGAAPLDFTSDLSERVAWFDGNTPLLPPLVVVDNTDGARGLGYAVACGADPTTITAVYARVFLGDDGQVATVRTTGSLEVSVPCSSPR